MTSTSKQSPVRLNLRIPPDERNQIDYFLSQHPHKWASANEFIRAAVGNYIAFLNGNYKIPDLEQQRLNQLIEGFHGLSSTIGSLESVLISGFESLMHVTRGSNYLLDQSMHEDREL